jgi:poly-gamma-glutamate synthesis protein (capsule biosynthesis protein)
MYFVSVDFSTGKLVHLAMAPTKIKQLRVIRASRSDASWPKAVLDREGREFGTRVDLSEDDTLALQLNRSP